MGPNFSLKTLRAPVSKEEEKGRGTKGRGAKRRTEENKEAEEHRKDEKEAQEEGGKRKRKTRAAREGGEEGAEESEAHRRDRSTDEKSPPRPLQRRGPRPTCHGYLLPFSKQLALLSALCSCKWGHLRI